MLQLWTVAARHKHPHCSNLPQPTEVVCDWCSMPLASSNRQSETTPDVSCELNLDPLSSINLHQTAESAGVSTMIKRIEREFRWFTGRSLGQKQRELFNMCGVFVLERHFACVVLVPSKYFCVCEKTLTPHPNCLCFYEMTFH